MGFLQFSIERSGRLGALALLLGAIAACGTSDKILTGQRYAIGDRKSVV